MIAGDHRNCIVLQASIRREQSRHEFGSGVNRKSLEERLDVRVDSVRAGPVRDFLDG